MWWKASSRDRTSPHDVQMIWFAILPVNNRRTRRRCGVLRSSVSTRSRNTLTNSSASCCTMTLTGLPLLSLNALHQPFGW